MDYTEISRLSSKVFLGFLGLTALIAIVSVLSGEFGKVQWKILAATLTVSAASICSMSCAAFIERKKLAGFETLAFPILMKLRTGNREKVERVVLERVRGDIYRDSTGKEFQVREIKTEHNAVQLKEYTLTSPPTTG